MLRLVLWIGICFVLAWLLRNRPVYAVVGVIVLWALVPALAGYWLTGQPVGWLAFHPATWLLLATLVVQLVINPEPLALALGRHALMILVVANFAALALLTSTVTGSGGTRLLMDQVVGPAVLWLLIVAYADRDRRLMLVVRNAVIVVIAAQCVLAIVQSIIGNMVFYARDYEKLYWFNPETFERWMGTTDSPLVLALCITVAGALTLGIRNWVLRFALLMLFLLGTVITQSRVGTAVMCLIILYSILRAHMVLWARALTCIAVVAAGYFIVTSTFVAGLAGRLANDTGSTDARLRALRFIYDHWTDYAAAGQGLTSSYTIARDAGLQTSIESSYLMYMVDVGLLLATLYFGAQIALLIRYGRQRALLGATLAGVVGTLFQHTFSAVAGTNLTGTVLWTALALVVVAYSVAPPLPPAVTTRYYRRPTALRDRERRQATQASGASTRGAPATASASTSRDV